MFDDAWCMHIYVRDTERDRESTAPLTRISTSHFLKSNFTLFAASFYKQIWKGCKIRTEFLRPLSVKESITTLDVWHIAVLGNTHTGATSTSWGTNIFCYQFHRTSVIQKSWLINIYNTPCSQDLPAYSYNGHRNSDTVWLFTPHFPWISDGILCIWQWAFEIHKMHNCTLKLYGLLYYWEGTALRPQKGYTLFVSELLNKQRKHL